jgi:protein TonB
MKASLLPLLFCGALAVLSEPRPAVAAFANSDAAIEEIIQVRPARRHAPTKQAAIAAQPALSEVQALHALETEISRKVGLQMKEADYPEEARRWTWRGITLVHVLVGRDGVMREISVGKTSGFRILDEQAVRVVSRVSAPSWIPDRLRGRDIRVLVPIGFVLPHGQ